MNPTREREGSPRSLIWIIIASVGAHVFVLVAGRTFLAHWRWPHLPLHALVESFGAFIALCLVPILLYLEGRGRGTSHNVPIANAVTTMGLLDGAHAAAHVGHTFVWLHSIATLLGGVCFALVWAPAGSPLARIRPLHVAVLTLAVILFSFSFPDLLPAMLTSMDEDGSFTLAARLANILGGVLFCIAAARLVLSYRATRNSDDLLFVIHCVLFGAAAIMFETSRLWDAPWWGWHVLRLLAYGAALGFLLLTLRLEARTLADRTRALEQKSRELERSNADLQQFAYVASHDLQEPLRQVASFTELLGKRYGDRLDARALSYIRYAVAGSLRMQRLINDLLDFAGVGRTDTALSPTDCNALIENVLEDLQQTLEESGARVTYDALPVVMAHEQQFRRVFQNLVVNAIKFRGDEPPRVHISAQREGELWRFSVADNGIGIEPGEAGRIFQMFQRLHPRDSYPGTGIGLAIAKKIVDRHGGRIWFESEPGAGATFHFTVSAEPAA